MGGGPPGFPQGFSCPVVLWILLADVEFRLLDFHRLWFAFPIQFDYPLSMLNAVRNPKELGSLVWPVSRSLAATKEIEFSFSSCCYLDVSVRNVPFRTLCIYVRIPEVCSGRFPHSEISGSKVICTSPKLIAAYHVFHRLLVPRHSPCALSCLTSHHFLAKIIIFYCESVKQSLAYFFDNSLFFGMFVSSDTNSFISKKICLVSILFLD